MIHTFLESLLNLWADADNKRENISDFWTVGGGISFACVTLVNLTN